MEPTQNNNAKDFFLNLSATVTLYIVVGSLISLLFTVINKAYPQITSGYQYYSSSSISWPVSMLVVFSPLYIWLMWIINKNLLAVKSTIHKWLTYLTLFLAGGFLVGSLVTTFYYFIDGQELTVGFLLKVVSILLVAGSVFLYYLSDVREKLTTQNRKYWRVYALVLVLASIVWGFVVLGSPATQRLYKYDEQKVNDLSNLSSNIENYYMNQGVLPDSLNGLTNYYLPQVDSQNKPYEYIKTGDLTYTLCAEFNLKSKDYGRGMSYMYGYQFSEYEAGRYCFDKTVNENMIYKR